MPLFKKIFPIDKHRHDHEKKEEKHSNSHHHHQEKNKIEIPKNVAPSFNTKGNIDQRSRGSRISEVLLNYSSIKEILNPLKGWMTYGGSHPIVPVHLEYKYFSMHAIVLDHHKYNFQPIDHWLENVARKKNHGVFRIVIDYPDNYPDYRAPDYLKLKTTAYKAYGDKGKYPDWFDPKFQQAILDMIAALGQKFDGDKRIAAIQIGLLGHWGEWHSAYPFPCVEFQTKVLKKFTTTFVSTNLLVSADALERYGPKLSSFNIGIHDDSYAGTSLKQCIPCLKKCGMDDKSRMFGGELTYCEGGNQKTFFNSKSGLDKFICTFECMPVSWLLNEALLNYNEAAYKRAMEASLIMGYQLYCEMVECFVNGIVVTIQNKGNCAFFYDISLHCFFTDREDKEKVVDLKCSPKDCHRLKYLTDDDEPLMIGFPFDLSAFAGSQLQLSLKFGSPMLYENQVLHFANEDDDYGLLNLSLYVDKDDTDPRLVENDSLDVKYRPIAQEKNPTPTDPDMKVLFGTEDPPPRKTTEIHARSIVVNAGKVEDEHTNMKLLHTMDHKEKEDNWDKYIEFNKAKKVKGISVCFIFEIDEGLKPYEIKCNWRGCEEQEQKWVFEVLNKKNEWEQIGSNKDVKTGWRWMLLEFPLPADILIDNGKFEVRYRTDQTSDASQIDYLMCLCH